MVWWRGLLVGWVLCWASVRAQEVSAAEQARAGVTRLQEWYVPATGLYRTTGWWNSANATTTLAEFCAVTESEMCGGVLGEHVCAGAGDGCGVSEPVLRR